MKYHVDIQNPYEYDDIPNRFRIQRFVSTTLEPLKASAELCIRVVDEAEIQALNAKYRNKDKPTNVLSFPSQIPEEVASEVPILGDIILCHPVVRQQADEQNKSIEAHWAHMIVHGVLHLLGYDHIDEKDAQVMEPLEISILANLGFENPYVVNE